MSIEEANRIYDKMEKMEGRLSEEIKAGVSIFCNYIDKKNDEEKEGLVKFTKLEGKVEENEKDIEGIGKKIGDSKKWWDNIFLKIVFLFATPMVSIFFVLIKSKG